MEKKYQNLTYIAVQPKCKIYKFTKQRPIFNITNKITLNFC